MEKAARSDEPVFKIAVCQSKLSEALFLEWTSLPFVKI